MMDSYFLNGGWWLLVFDMLVWALFFGIAFYVILRHPAKWLRGQDEGEQRDIVQEIDKAA